MILKYIILCENDRVEKLGDKDRVKC